MTNVVHAILRMLRPQHLILVPIALLALAGCASDPVSLEIRLGSLREGNKIAQPVAFLHSKTFREDLQTVEPYGNKYYLPLKTGEASDRALRTAYAQVFESPREVTSLEDLRSLSGPQAPVAVIEPSIVELNYLNASGRTWGPYYSEIVYRFSLFDTTGAQVADWRVRGFGQFDMNREAGERRPDFPRGEVAWMSEAPRRAVEAAAANFVASFERVPELVRLTRNLPFAGANAPAALQVIRNTAPARPGLEASYPSVFTLHVERASAPQLPKELLKDESQVSYLLPVRLTLENRGTHRLAIDPAEAQWLPEETTKGSSKPISPLPAPVVPAFIAGRPLGVVVGVMSPGVGMLPALFAAFVSAAEHERQKKDLAAWSAAINRELLDAGITAAGASRGGVIYFARPPQRDGGTIVIPVVDLDDAVRYTVRVRLPEK
jgi:hypothetical protein